MRGGGRVAHAVSTLLLGSMLGLWWGTVVRVTKLPCLRFEGWLPRVLAHSRSPIPAWLAFDFEGGGSYWTLATKVSRIPTGGVFLTLTTGPLFE